ncbi:DUF6636 domain-containing protein [Nocardia sp. NPDC050406]|uniref:DUF6636 domain-containing protein n=1 Tax=Nocardia sp. NPDC050406 TaxID=3364318 RepID=UPI0037A974A1
MARKVGEGAALSAGIRRVAAADRGGEMKSAYLIRTAVAVAALGTVSAGVAAAVPPAYQDGFQSPSGNITCVLADKGAVCEIANHTYATPAEPADCHQSYGDRITLFQGDPARFACHGDTIRETGLPVLRYGHSLRSGDVECFSERSGIRCVNDRFGHSFRISSESYELA